MILKTTLDLHHTKLHTPATDIPKKNVENDSLNFMKSSLSFLWRLGIRVLIIDRYFTFTFEKKRLEGEMIYVWTSCRSSVIIIL